MLGRAYLSKTRRSHEDPWSLLRVAKTLHHNHPRPIWSKSIFIGWQPYHSFVESAQTDPILMEWSIQLPPIKNYFSMLGLLIRVLGNKFS
ncbi:hypothetical protein TNCT_197321 [Trichonephila clavata]|uniref:Uncharacterized protein n=1 Tax=Trichonephila clavata TaxID=2740835 RepID=A0A8X6LYK6_TRICU|nr:hypothetical protein TNCT_197321 [Trichonephila clavata]